MQNLCRFAPIPLRGLERVQYALPFRSFFAHWRLEFFAHVRGQVGYTYPPCRTKDKCRLYDVSQFTYISRPVVLM
jgi:hypothetical protein